jgi:MoaA/NifB/PqqE/SkfB family radical SAM enzyme
MDSSVDFEGILKGFVAGMATSEAVIGYATRSPARAIRALRAQGFQRRQAEKRAEASERGLPIPPILIASVTRRCNLDCTGCYSKARRAGAGMELSTKRFLGLVQEAVDLGVGVIMLAGGEPLLRMDLIEGVSRIKGIVAPVFTNGLLAGPALFEACERGTVIPIFSIEGRLGQTDARRGAGVHRAVLGAMAEMRERRLVFGASITATSENADLVLSKAFIDELSTLGPALLFMVEYVPAATGTEALVLTDAQRERLNDPAAFEGAAFKVVPLPGNEEKLGGCLAAGRGFIHMAEDGSLEACPFAAYSDANAARVGFKAALASPLMRALRERHGELGESKGGCALWNKGGWVAGLSACASQEGASVA